ncbi:hypothetical protein ABQZ08_21325, partial [Xanthomonas hortorum pv. hederae]
VAWITPQHEAGSVAYLWCVVQRFLSGDLLASQIQVVLPGEAVGQWRLEEIDRNTAVFRAGEQTRRLAIP